MREFWTRWVSLRWGRNATGRFVVFIEFKPLPKGAIVTAQPSTDPRHYDLELHLAADATPYYLPRGERP